MRRSVVTALLLGVAFASHASTVARKTFDSAVLGRDYVYTVYLPDDYDPDQHAYPVMYLLHGSGGNEMSWLVAGDLRSTADRLIEAGAIPPAVIVMPASRSWWVDGHNEAAETALLSDLIPHIETSFSVIPAREGRLIGGLSAGGYGTVNLVLKHPDVFAAGAALSPASYTPYPPPDSSANVHPTYLGSDGSFDRALWTRLNYPQHVEVYKAQDFIVPLYINSGDHDLFDIAYHAAVLYQSIREHQPDSVEFRVVDGDHEWSVWRETLPDALQYVFRFASPPIEAGATASR